MAQDWFAQFEPAKKPASDPWFDQFQEKKIEERAQERAKLPKTPVDIADLASRGLFALSREGMQQAADIESIKRGERPSPIIGEPVGFKLPEFMVPKFKQPETWWGGFANKLYEDYIASQLRGYNPLIPEKLPPLFDKEIGGVSKINLPPVTEARIGKINRLALPPAEGPEVAGPTRTFYQGAAGTTERGRTYPLDLGAQNPRMAGGISPASAGTQMEFGTELGTVLPRELENVSQIPAMEAAERGLTVGEIPELRMPGPGEVVDIPSVRRRLEAATKGPTRITYGGAEERGFYPGKVGEPQLPSAPVKPTRFPKAQPATPAAFPPPTAAGKITVPSAQQAITVTSPNLPNLPVEFRKIAATASPEEALTQWATGSRYGAPYRARMAREAFADLKDPALIDKFESGDRTGRLADLQKFFDERQKQAVDIGILKKDQKILNYLRHYYTQDPEKVTAAVKKFITENPQFAKTRKFPTYAIAESEGGLTRKFKTIPEIVEAYEDEFQKAVRKKELYDWAKSSGVLKKGLLSTSPTQWELGGPNAELTREILNTLHAKSPRWARVLGEAGRYTKNLYLGSGIGGTPLNTHYYNTMKSSFYAQGFEGIKDYLQNTFNPAADIKYLDQNKKFIADLVDRGFGHNIEDHTLLANLTHGVDAPNKLLQAAEWVKDTQGKIFEDPLFRVRLPAAKVKLARKIYDDALSKGLGNEEALRQAATISNDFMGGLNKVLRHATTKDLMSFGIVAPDWLESRLNLAVKGVKALVGKEHPIYKQALYRKAAVTGATLGANKLITGEFEPTGRSGNISRLYLGQTAGGANRTFPSLGTTAEEFRFPLEVMSAFRNPNESWIEKLQSLSQGRVGAVPRAILGAMYNIGPFNAPVAGHDRYGRMMSPETQTKNIIGTVGAPLEPPWLKFFRVLATQGSDVDLERAIAEGFELPTQYNKEPRPNLTVSMPR